MRDDRAFADTLETWQPVIGKAILEAWGLPQRICEAVVQPSCDYSTRTPSSC